MALEEVTGNPRAAPPAAVVKPTSLAIVPCYSEEKVLPETTARLIKAITRLLHAGQVAPSTRRCDPLHSSHVE